MNAISHAIALYSRIALKSYEKVFVAYLLITAVLSLIAYERLDNWYVIVLNHLLLVAAVYAIHSIPAQGKPLLRIFKDFYIFLYFPFLFKELSSLSRALFPYYLEPFLIASDRLFFGLFQEVFTTLHGNKLVNEFMAFSYGLYYILVPGIGIYLYIKRPFGQFEAFAYRFVATMFFCYFLFILIPVRGPHHSAFQANPQALEGYVFFNLIGLLQKYGSTVGAAFPSSHVAGTWIAFFTLRRLNEKLYYLLLPLMVSLTISVFYLRYHYVLDALGGYLVALGLNIHFLKQEQDERIEQILLKRRSALPLSARMKS